MSFTKDVIQDWLAVEIARVVGVDVSEIDSHVAFDRYGMDSSMAVQLTSRLEKWLKRDLSPTLLYDYPTIDALSDYLADATSTASAAE